MAGSYQFLIAHHRFFQSYDKRLGLDPFLATEKYCKCKNNGNEQSPNSKSIGPVVASQINTNKIRVTILLWEG